MPCAATRLALWRPLNGSQCRWISRSKRSEVEPQRRGSRQRRCCQLFHESTVCKWRTDTCDTQLEAEDEPHQREQDARSRHLRKMVGPQPARIVDDGLKLPQSSALLHA